MRTHLNPWENTSNISSNGGKGGKGGLSYLVEEIEAFLTTAMRHPYALFLLIASASLAGAMQFLPWLRFASDFAWWVLLLGGVSYAASILVLLRWEAPLRSRSYAYSTSSAGKSRAN